MKVFGLRIGDTGIEFPSREEREKAMILFSRGSTKNVSNSGIKYADGKDSFSTYERDEKFTIVTCAKCSGEFDIDSAPKRDYPYMYSYSKKWETENGFICDGCFEKANKAKAIWDAEELIKKKDDISV